MSTKWYLLKELKLSFKTVGLGDFNDHLIYRKNSSMLRKMGVWRKLPGGPRISFSTGFNLSPLVPSPETSRITSHGDKVSPGVLLITGKLPACIHAQLVSTPTSSVQLLQFDCYPLISHFPLSEGVFKRSLFAVVVLGFHGGSETRYSLSAPSALFAACWNPTLE